MCRTFVSIRRHQVHKYCIYKWTTSMIKDLIMKNNSRFFYIQRSNKLRKKSLHLLIPGSKSSEKCYWCTCFQKVDLQASFKYCFPYFKEYILILSFFVFKRVCLLENLHHVLNKRSLTNLSDVGKLYVELLKNVN